MNIGHYLVKLETILSEPDFETKYRSLLNYIQEVNDVSREIYHSTDMDIHEKPDILNKLANWMDIADDEFKILTKIKIRNIDEQVVDRHAQVETYPHVDLPLVHHRIRTKVAEITQDSSDPMSDLLELHHQLVQKFDEVMDTETDDDKLASRTAAIINAQMFVLDQATKYQSPATTISTSQPDIQSAPVAIPRKPLPVSAPTQISCPKCGNTQLTAQKKGFGVVKGAALGILGVATGGVALGAAGLATGNIGRQKVLITCVACGNQWKAGAHK